MALWHRICENVKLHVLLQLLYVNSNSQVFERLCCLYGICAYVLVHDKLEVYLRVGYANALCCVHGYLCHSLLYLANVLVHQLQKLVVLHFS